MDACPAPKDCPLALLLAAAARGDSHAFAELYDQTSARIFGLVLGVVADQTAAAEVTQEVYRQVWRDAALPRTTSVLSWLTALAHREAVARVRAAAPDDDSLTEGFLLVPRLPASLDDLEDDQHRALDLAYFGARTHVDIARTLGVTPRAAQRAIRDGLHRMRMARVAEA